MLFITDSSSSLWSIRMESEQSMISMQSRGQQDSASPPIPLLAILQRTMSDVKTGGWI